MSEKKKEKPTATTLPGICPNPGAPFSLWELIEKLQAEKGFAADFMDLLKLANNNEKGAIDCVNSLLEPSARELTDLGIPASQLDSFRKCTESGVLVAAIAEQAAGRSPK